MLAPLKSVLARSRAAVARLLAERAQQKGDVETFVATSGEACLIMIALSGIAGRSRPRPNVQDFNRALRQLDGRRDRLALRRAGTLHSIALGLIGDSRGCIGFGAAVAEYLEGRLGFWDQVKLMELSAYLETAFRVSGEASKAQRYIDLIESRTEGLFAKRPPPSWAHALFEAERQWMRNNPDKAISLLESELGRHRTRTGFAARRADPWMHYITARLRSYRALRSGNSSEIAEAHKAEANIALSEPKLGADTAAKLVLDAAAALASQGNAHGLQRDLACQALSFADRLRNPETVQWRALNAIAPTAQSAAEAILLSKLAIGGAMSSRSALIELDQTLGESESGELARLFQALVAHLVGEHRVFEASEIINLRRNKEGDPTAATRAGQRGMAPTLSRAETLAAAHYHTARSSHEPLEIAACLDRMGLEIGKAAAASAEAQSRFDATLFRTLQETMPLGSGDALVQIMPGAQLTTVAVRLKERIILQTADVGAPTINRMVFRLREAVFRHRASEPPTAARELHELLIEPFMAELEDARIERLVVAATGALQSLPFALLHDGRGWLVERFSLVRAPLDGMSLSVVPRFPPSVFLGGTSRGEPGVAEPLDDLGELDHAAATVARFARLERCDEGDFSASRVMRAFTSCSVMVLAAHCLLDPTAPGNSRLFLGDGTFFTLGSLSRTRSDLDLIVLSACSTGTASAGFEIGADYTTDRVILAAGARAVVATAWNVDHEAQRSLMTRFIENLFTGAMSKDDALARAQMALLRGEIGPEPEHDVPGTGWRSPYYWAAPMLTGNWLPFPIPGDPVRGPARA